MKIVYEAADINEAHIVRGMLQANGIEAHVGGYYLQGGIGELAAQDNAKVYVADEDEVQAREVIIDYDSHASRSGRQDDSSGFYKSIGVTLLVVIFIIYMVALFG